MRARQPPSTIGAQIAELRYAPVASAVIGCSRRTQAHWRRQSRVRKATLPISHSHTATPLGATCLASAGSVVVTNPVNAEVEGISITRTGAGNRLASSARGGSHHKA